VVLRFVLVFDAALVLRFVLDFDAALVFGVVLVLGVVFVFYARFLRILLVFLATAPPDCFIPVVSARYVFVCGSSSTFVTPGTIPTYLYLSSISIAAISIIYHSSDIKKIERIIYFIINKLLQVNHTKSFRHNMNPSVYECTVHNTPVNLIFDTLTNVWIVDEKTLGNLKLLKPLSKINLYSIVKKLSAKQLEQLIKKNVGPHRAFEQNINTNEQNINKKIVVHDEMKKIYALYEASMAFSKKIKSNVVRKMIIFNEKEIFDIIAQQYAKIYESYCIKRTNVMYVRNNIYNWKIQLHNIKLRADERSDDRSICLSIFIHPHYFPHTPPQICVTQPLFKNDLSHRIKTSKFTQIKYWNPNRSIERTIERTIEVIERYGEVVCDELTENMVIIDNLIYRLSTTIDSQYIDPIDDDHTHTLHYRGNHPPNNNDDLKAPGGGSSNGTGYGHDAAPKWNVSEFNQLNEEKEYQLTDIFINLNILVERINNFTPGISCENVSSENISSESSDLGFHSKDHKYLYEAFKKSCICRYMICRLNQTTMLDISENWKFYAEVFKLIRLLVGGKIGELFYVNFEKNMSMHSVFIGLAQKAKQSLKLEDSAGDISVSNQLIVRIHEIMTDRLTSNDLKSNDLTSNDLTTNNLTSNDLTTNNLTSNDARPNDAIIMVDDAIVPIDEPIDVNPIDTKELYIKEMAKYKWITADLINSGYKYKTNIVSPGISTRGCVKRLIAETPSLADSLSIEWDAMVLLCTDKKNLNCMRFLVTGPKDTPYENGILIFDAYMPPNYPTEAPMFHLMNTSGYRLNPNLYADGKVCLSLLGTYIGPKPDESERWISRISTLYQVIISIQSQILVEKPYFNEPGYFSSMGTPAGESRSNESNELIRTAAMQATMLDLLDRPDTFPEFKETIQQYFKFKRFQIKKQLIGWIDLCKSPNIKEQMVILYNRINVLLDAL